MNVKVIIAISSSGIFHIFVFYISHRSQIIFVFTLYLRNIFNQMKNQQEKKKKVMWRGLNRRKKTEWNKKGRLNHILLRWIKSDKCWENLLKQSHHFLSFSNFSICFPSFIWFFKGQFMVKTHFNTVQMTLCPGMPSCKKVLQNCLLLPC